MKDKKFNFNLLFYLTLTLLIICLIFAYNKSNAYNKLENAFNEEKIALQQDFNELIDDYKDLSIKKNELSKRLKKEINKIISLKDSVKNLKASNFNLIRKYRRKVAYLERQNKALFIKVDSLSNENSDLKQQSIKTENLLASKNNQAKKLITSNAELQQKNDELTKKVAIAGIIKTNAVSAMAMKERSSGKLINTRRSYKTDAFKISFTLLENQVTTPGIKDIYIQIVDESKNVITPKGTVQLKNKKSISYSDKLQANYNNESLDVLSLVLVNRDDIHKGNYFVNIFVDGYKTGQAVIGLK